MTTGLGIVGLALLYVGLMNYLGGEKHLFGNRIRQIIQDLKKD